MTHMFKLSRRTARLRASIVTLAMVAACDQSQPFESSSTTSDAAPSFATTSTSTSAVAVTNLSARSGKTYRAVAGLGVGDVSYIDRSYTYSSSVPTAVQGATFIQTANDDKNASLGSTSFLTFNVDKSAIVYVGYDKRLTKPTWLSSAYQDAAIELTSSDGLAHYRLYKRSVSAGTVTLGSNTTTTVKDASMYVVLVQPATTTTPTDPVSSPDQTTTSPSPIGSGIPFGDFHLPTTEFSNPRYSGSLQSLGVSDAVTMLNAAKSKGQRLVISVVGNRKYYTNADGTFNMSLWKKRVDAFRGIDFGAYVASGTVIGHYMLDEPFCSTCWGGKSIPAADVEEIGRYSKSIWPTMPTIVRSPAAALPLQKYNYVDVAWAQWEGPLHWPNAGQTPEQYRDKEIAAAQARGLGLVFGLNYLDAGDGSSHINGTYAFDPNPSDNVYCVSGGSCYRYEMSAAEVQRVGSVFAAASYACAVLNWQYDTDFINRTGMKAALDAVASVARNRSRSSCAR